ncbi:MAG TPA: transporter, partial [Flavobacterium sp.]|nr:transporter [Flavobacterium sp.]
RIGGEYRIKNVSLRAGYRNEQSPYKNGNTIGDLNAFSGGFGYNFGNTRLDLSYTHARRYYNQPMYSAGFVNAPAIRETSNNISLGLVFEL